MFLAWPLGNSCLDAKSHTHDEASSALPCMTSQHVGLLAICSDVRRHCAYHLWQACLSSLASTPVLTPAKLMTHATAAQSSPSCLLCIQRPVSASAFGFSLLVCLSLQMILWVSVQNTLVEGGSRSHKLTYWAATGLHLQPCQLTKALVARAGVNFDLSAGWYDCTLVQVRPTCADVPCGNPQSSLVAGVMHFVAQLSAELLICKGTCLHCCLIMACIIYAE